METQSAATLLEDLNERVTKSITLIRSHSMSREKEQRQFATRMFSLTPLVQLGFGGQGFNVLMEQGPLAPLRLLESLLKRTVENAEGVVVPKPSQKTRSSGDKSKVIFDKLSCHIRGLERDGHMGTLQELCSAVDRSGEFHTATYGLLCTSPWLIDLLTILSKDLPGPEDYDAYLLKWYKLESATLHEKVYLNRGDIRAFVSDGDELRSLIGSILHYLLHPKDKNVRSTFAPYTTSMPESKHILNHLTTIVKPHQSVAVLFGDISSFTASFKNIWVVLICLTLNLESDDCDRTLIISIRGALLEVNLVQALRLYLYLASVVRVKDETRSFVSVGGMLGISGIDTLAKTLFGLFLQRLCKTLTKVSATPRVGGDDFTVTITYSTSKPDNLQDAINRIREATSESIGFLKEYSIARIPRGFDNILPYRFCKKQVRASFQCDNRGYGKLVLMSQWPLPLLTAVFDEPGQCWDELDTISFVDSLKSVPWVEDREYLQSVYFTVAVIRHHVPPVGVKLKKIYEIPPPETFDGFTEKAMQVVLSVPPIHDSQGRMYRDTPWLKSQTINPRRFKRVVLTDGQQQFWITYLASEPLCQRCFRDKFELPLLLSIKDDGVKYMLRMLEEWDEAMGHVR